MIVEDDEKLAALVAEYLTQAGFEPVIETNGLNAIDRIIQEAPDLVILDWMLPDKDGIEICKAVRSRYPGVILMLTARSDEIDEIQAFEAGVDDYLAKPVRPLALTKRIKSHLTKTEIELPPNAPKRITLGRLVIDAARREAHFYDVLLDLTTGEFDLLWYFAQRPGQQITRDETYRDLRGIEWDGLDRSIDLRVARLRKKLGDDARMPSMIKSIRGIGYLLAVN